MITAPRIARRNWCTDLAVPSCQSEHGKFSTVKVVKQLAWGGGMQLVDKCRGTGAAAQVLRVRYVTQVKARPPTFAIFVSGADTFPELSVRMMRNALREAFAFQGVPLRVLVRYKRARRTAI